MMFYVEEFPVATELANAILKKVREECLRVPVLKHKLYQVNVHTTLSGEAMCSLIYHKKLEEEWEKAAEELR